MAEQYLSAHELDDNLSRYVGRRIKIKFKEALPLFQEGAILTCVAGYYDEHAIDIDDEREDEFIGYGLFVSDAVLDNTPIPYLGNVAFADIAGFIPLEGENTPEEIEQWFEKARGITVLR